MVEQDGMVDPLEDKEERLEKVWVVAPDSPGSLVLELEERLRSSPENLLRSLDQL